MKLFGFIDLLKTIAKAQPNVGEVVTGDITQLNTNQSVNYPAIVITQQYHQLNNSNDTERFGVVLFAVDRLTEDKNNQLMVQDWANSVIINILEEVDKLGIQVDNYSSIEVFNQKFDSLCAGAFVKTNFTVDLDECKEGFEPYVRSLNGRKGDVVLKTINNQSVIGPGNIDIQGGESYDDTELRDRIETLETEITTKAEAGALQNFYIKPVIDEKVSKLEKEISDKADKSEIPSVPANVSAFRNDAGYITLSQVPKAHLDNYTEYGNSARIFANNTYIDVIDKELHLHSDEDSGQSDLYLKPHSIETEIRYADDMAVSYTSTSTHSNSHNFKSYHSSVGDLSIYSSYNGIFIYNYDMSRNINSSLTFNTDGLQVNGNQVVAEWFGTQAEYDGLIDKDNNIIYNIYED